MVDSSHHSPSLTQLQEIKESEGIGPLRLERLMSRPGTWLYRGVPHCGHPREEIRTNGIETNTSKITIQTLGVLLPDEGEEYFDRHVIPPDKIRFEDVAERRIGFEVRVVEAVRGFNGDKDSTESLQLFIWSANPVDAWSVHQAALERVFKVMDLDSNKFSDNEITSDNGYALPKTGPDSFLNKVWVLLIQDLTVRKISYCPGPFPSGV